LDQGKKLARVERAVNILSQLQQHNSEYYILIQLRSVGPRNRLSVTYSDRISQRSTRYV